MQNEMIRVIPGCEETFWESNGTVIVGLCDTLKKVDFVMFRFTTCKEFVIGFKRELFKFVMLGASRRRANSFDIV